MDHHPRSNSGNFEDNVGIPEDLRCKRSDGKQWRCSAMSMPDKTVCEKHYIQAKKRAANSALRANMKKAKRKSLGESDSYMDSFQSHLKYSPESPPLRTSSNRNPPKLNDDLQRDIGHFDENHKSLYKSPTASAMESSRNKTQKNFDANVLAENSDGSTDSSYGAGGLRCHQCRRNDSARVVWCMKCDRRGYCDNCASKWYPDIPLEEIQRVCPACRGTCNCKVCLRGDNLIKVRIREIGAPDKLQYLYCLLSSILPVIKQIHSDQCFELELNTRLNGTKADIPRAKLNADEQKCCNCCRIPIIDYHRHCTNCLYDLCLTCCRDLRQESLVAVRGKLAENQISERSQEGATVTRQQKLSEIRRNLADQFPNWKANSDGAIPCPPKDSGGCGSPSLALRRIFKMNWVAKLVKNVEEMVNGCKVYDDSQQATPLRDSKMCQFAHREESNDNFLYSPLSQDIKLEGIGTFQKHWVKGEPVIIKQVSDCTSSSSWDPMIIWRGIRETTDEKTKDENRTVKAIDCLDCAEVDIELGQFIKGYSEGRIHENGWPEMLKLKDWPSPSASEEFLLYQRPEFISKLPLLEYIHSKWGLLNVAAKLPHYSLQNDVGPKIFISYGTYEELGRGDSVTNLHTNMRDMVYLLMHTFEVKLKGWQRTKIEKIQKTFRESEAKESDNILYTSESLGDAQINSGEVGKSPELSPDEHGTQNEGSAGVTTSKDEIMEDQVWSGTEITSGGERKEVVSGSSDKDVGDAVSENAPIGAIWDVFRRQDVPKLIEYSRVYWKEFRQSASLPTDSVMNPLYNQAVFLNRDHKRKLKEEFRIEPWTFEQRLGEAVFIPAGCPFQVRNLQSSVQLALDFLSPESLGESIRLAEEIRCLPNDHEAKLQMLEVGKMSLYAASSAIREVQKLALDPKAGLGFEDPDLTALVSENLEKMIRRRQIACV
ncbi:zinc finger protein [Macleaya cordata]|uniref:Zinc finger protein n=1 Tax=Macleaya cordata TaxID=56857 RepID=A0A200Q9E9_MACCD|nr:zinc finger protein [Macleaya cordata]